MIRPIDIIRRARTIAVVGLSTNPAKPSAAVAAYLQQQGMRVIPVHPTADTLLGEKAYRALSEIPDHVDIVDVFRPAAEAEDWARAAIAIGADCLWLQQGIVNPAAARIAEAHGMDVVMDECTAIVHREWRRQGAQQASQ
ncbi:CoA-binding protein [Synoicihabitans lomoniglobus]|uniref:CoA-binding protein n=1 Tax=Synoicihabitans lomoniglobus TaxID=2909285 RepID=A0AAE9ZYM8_9BACT|nr:CoA-binding protein [Opitutaceae bacterium LMO-M01]WED65485.1 CoA-binding protein [Opitutaceae bacterium LMO-M01]